jgi:hypothetical protein
MTWADRPSLTPPARPAPPPRRGAGAATVAVLWLLSLAVLGGAGYACYAWRAKVMAVWPPSQRVFAALGVR